MEDKVEWYVGCLLINNSVLIQYGKLKTSNTLPVSYTTSYVVSTSNTRNSTSGSTATYNDLSFYTGAITGLQLSSFTCRSGEGYWIAIGY